MELQRQILYPFAESPKGDFMSFATIIQSISDYILFAVCVFILLGSIYISVRMRFVQLRCFPLLFQMLKSFSSREESTHTISPHKALFTAMSTTLGIGTIVAPVIAISLGGPG